MMGGMTLPAPHFTTVTEVADKHGRPVFVVACDRVDCAWWGVGYALEPFDGHQAAEDLGAEHLVVGQLRDFATAHPSDAII